MNVCETTVHPMDGMFEPSGKSLRRVVERMSWQAFNDEIKLKP
jgi:hypothetical protein